MSQLIDDYLDRRGLAAELKVSERTIERYDAMRIGPPRVKIGSRWYYPRQRARDWLAARTQPQARAG